MPRRTDRRISETVTAYGHQNILATHRTTFEITRRSKLTRRGDCIVAVRADKALVDLNSNFKKAARNERAKILITIEANGLRETIQAYGNPKLTLTNKTDMVIRKSNFICDRTLAIRANKAAKDFSRKLIQKLQNPNQKVLIILTIEHGGPAGN